MQRPGSITITDLDSFPADNIAVIRPGSHIVKSCSRLLFTIDEHPVNRASAPIFGKQRTMQIQTPFRRDIKDRLTNHLSIIKRKNDIRPKLPDLLRPQGMVDILRRKNRYPLRCRKLGNRIEPHIFIWIVSVSENRTDFNPVAKQSFDPDTTDIVISKYNRLHIITSRISLSSISRPRLFFPATCSTKYRGRPLTS